MVLISLFPCKYLSKLRKEFLWASLNNLPYSKSGSFAPSRSILCSPDQALPPSDPTTHINFPFSQPQNNVVAYFTPFTCKNIYHPLYKVKTGVPWWGGGLRIQCCHCCGSGHSCSVGWIPGPGTSTSHRHSQKRERDSNLK